MLVLKADAEEVQPQRISSQEWTRQDHPMFYASRSVRQPWDPSTYLVITTTDQTQPLWTQKVPCLNKKL